MFNIESMIELEDKMPDIMKMNLCANWFGSKGFGNVTIECIAYKGGVIVHAWELTNAETDIDERGEYLFPTSDGKINMPDYSNGGYKECWYGEVVRANPIAGGEPIYFRVNPVDDSIFELPSVKVIRTGNGMVYKDGYCWYENTPNTKYKVWNNQINLNGRNRTDALVEKNNTDHFNLYKYTRDADDDIRKELSDLKAELAVTKAIRPYQDKLIQCEMEKMFTAGINYTDRKTCNVIYGVVTLPNEPTVTGLVGRNAYGCLPCGFTQPASGTPAQ